jgi:hypothetical protein
MDIRPFFSALRESKLNVVVQMLNGNPWLLEVRNLDRTRGTNGHRYTALPNMAIYPS